MAGCRAGTKDGLFFPEHLGNATVIAAVVLKAASGR